MTKKPAMEIMAALGKRRVWKEKVVSLVSEDGREMTRDLKLTKGFDINA